MCLVTMDVESLYTNIFGVGYVCIHIVMFMQIINGRTLLYIIAPNFLLKKLDVTYHSVIRFVTNAPYNTHHCELYALVGWPSLTMRRLTHWYQLIYKSLLGKVPLYLSCLVTIAVPTRSLRSSRYIALVTPKVCTTFGRQSFQFAAANNWNGLQKTLKLKTLMSPVAFKLLLSEHLTDLCTC